ncbi:primosomal protein N' [uncultured Parvimonas sp.]|uniref:primosomal protein N' n=1 Tax=uncultured Parvimonas sp. TaxID=747372 RepID=UPI002804F2DE|nr:primosomal protein N' [uncultured Parvimonas sp.]
MLAEVVVKSFLLSRAENIFTYRVPKELEGEISAGKRVIVPFGKGNKGTVGLVLNILDEKDVETDIKFKEINMLIDEKEIVSKTQIELAKFMSKKYITNLSYCLNCVLPPGDWSKIEEFFVLNKEKNFELSKDEMEFFSKKRNILEIREFYNDEKINYLIKNEILVKKYKYNISENKFLEKFVKLNEEFDISKIRKNAVKQLELLNFLKGKDFVSVKKLREINISKQVIDSMLLMNALILTENKVYKNSVEETKNYKKLKLNEEQQNVLDSILDSKNDKFLIHGVTGSGKTEIYLQLVEKMLEQGKSSIILVPEISLTPQTIERFSGRFGNDIAIIHSRLTMVEKLNQWKQIQDKDIKIVVGARSAIFSPIKNLGLVIIDEEHESSYISDQNPKYYTHEVAEHLVKLSGAKLVLGSATPSVNIYELAKKGKFKLLELKNRATRNSLPQVEIVDMREELLLGNKSILSNSLYEEIQKTLDRKEQVILFLNKRGRSSFVFCRSCGYVLKCDYCDISMTYHKDNRKDICICHMCGRTKQKPKICPSCFKQSIKEFGFGTEALEEYIKNTFKDAKVHRIDSDTSKEKGAYEEVYQKMKNKEIDILIGTQMISKGLDFPNVTLVGVVLADISLNIPSFRSAEKTFQLLTQVAGRSGRGERQGKVVIQTYKPSHYSVVNSSEHNYEEFFKEEINFRRSFLYPPKANIINFQFRSKSVENCMEELKKIRDLIFERFKEEINLKNIIILGPNPDAIKWVNMVYRYNLTIKVLKDEDVFRQFLMELIFNKKYSFNTEKNGKLILTID